MAESVSRRFWLKASLDPKTGCWNFGTKGKYGSFSHKGSRWQAHRFAYAYIHGGVPRTKLVRHKCDNKSCVNPAHLELGTNADNQQDWLKRQWPKTKGFAPAIRGKVHEVRRLKREGGLSPTEIAKEMGMKESQVRFILG